jgi:hypothetical protein
VDALVFEHGLDPNFPAGALERLKDFLAIADDIIEKPELYTKEISEIKVQVSLLTSNSPYAEVRAVVDPHDDPSLPVSTIRSWIIGLFFVVVIAFINQLFSVRQPSIFLSSVIVQLMAYPCGKAAAKWLPDVGIVLFGVRHSLNPGPFNKKEHMLISIMASVGKTMPSSRNISKLCIATFPNILTKVTTNIFNSLYPMDGHILWPKVCEFFQLPDSSGHLYKPDGIRLGWLV